ncbi:MAG: amidohydrolase family protein, partial [Spirochaetes bacterium]|nr:amidohydrolase family protein [Spirochaetota bacterium]
MDTILYNALLALEDGLKPGSLRFSGGRVVEVDTLGASSAPSARTASRCRLIDAEGMIAAPGLIDLHCHGGSGYDVNDEDPGSVAAVAEFHRAHGVTAMMPSIAVDARAVMERSLDRIRAAVIDSDYSGGSSEILGAHLEGPFISERYRGCQDIDNIRPMDSAAIAFLESWAGSLARVTLAPELPGALEAIPRLREAGMTVSIGHSEADAKTCRLAADRGATLVTHLYNAMSSVRKDGPYRVPGVLEAALTDDRLFAEIIADGIHVPAELVSLALRCKGPKRLLVCSDANRGAGLPDSSVIEVCGSRARVSNGVAVLEDGTGLAGSVTTLDGMVRYMASSLGLPVHEALLAASAVPAMAAGVADRKGHLRSGYDADIILLDSKLAVRRVWCRGVERSKEHSTHD